MVTQADAPIATNTMNRPLSQWKISVSTTAEVSRTMNSSSGKGVHHVGEAHDQTLGAAALPAGQRPERQSDEHDDDLRDERHRHRHLRAVDGARQQVAAQVVGPQQMVGQGERWDRAAARGAHRGEVLDPVVPRRDHRSDDREQRHQADDHQPGHAGAAVEQATQASAQYPRER